MDSRIIAKMPTNLGFDEVETLSLMTLTAWESLFDRLDVAKPVAGGQRVLLVIGGAGGVGSVAIQLAKILTDLTVVASASCDESVAWCQKLGADFSSIITKILRSNLKNWALPSLNVCFLRATATLI